MLPDNPVSNTSTTLNFKNFYHVTRPATDRTLSQAIVLIKALIREYGMPTHIRISTSYEMGKPLSLRKKHKRIQENRDKKLAPLFQTASDFSPTFYNAGRMYSNHFVVPAKSRMYVYRYDAYLCTSIITN